MFEICDDQTMGPCTVDDLRDSRKGRNVVYVRQDLLQATWLADVLKMPPQAEDLIASASRAPGRRARLRARSTTRSS